MFYGENEAYEVILAGGHHRIDNPSNTKKRIIEVSVARFASTVKESDIVRLEDDYGRVKK